MRFNINDYPSKYVMHCKTEEEDKSFRAYLHSVGREWSSGASYFHTTYWHSHREDTCYKFNGGEYGSKNFYAERGYTILEWSDFMSVKFTKAHLRNGDVVQKRNGTVEIVCVDTGTLINQDNWDALSDISEDLTSVLDNKYDIVAVRRPNTSGDCRFSAFEYKYGELVYERDEVEEMTLEEICKALGKNIKIVKGA